MSHASCLAVLTRHDCESRQQDSSRAYTTLQSAMTLRLTLLCRGKALDRALQATWRVLQDQETGLSASIEQQVSPGSSCKKSTIFKGAARVLHMDVTAMTLFSTSWCHDEADILHTWPSNSQ